MLTKTKSKNNGFTLIEILLGVAISSLIFITAGSVFAVLFRSDVKTQRLSLISQTKNDLQIDFSNSIRWVNDVSFVNGSNPSITADTTIYTLVDGRILKNGEALTSKDVVVKKITTTDYSLASDLKSLEIVVEVENKLFPNSQDILKIVVSQRRAVY